MEQEKVHVRLLILAGVCTVSYAAVRMLNAMTRAAAPVAVRST